MMGGKRGGFAAAGERKFCEQRIGRATSDFGKGIAIEEKKWRAPMATAEKIEQFLESYFAFAERFPFAPDSRMSFSSRAKCAEIPA